MKTIVMKNNPPSSDGCEVTLFISETKKTLFNLRMERTPSSSVIGIVIEPTSRSRDFYLNKMRPCEAHGYREGDEHTVFIAHSKFAGDKVISAFITHKKPYFFPPHYFFVV